MKTIFSFQNYQLPRRKLFTNFSVSFHPQITNFFKKYFGESFDPRQLLQQPHTPEDGHDSTTNVHDNSTLHGNNMVELPSKAQFRRFGLSGLRWLRGETNPSAELRSRRHLCKDSVNNQHWKPWRFPSSQFTSCFVVTPVFLQSRDHDATCAPTGHRRRVVQNSVEISALQGPTTLSATRAS